MGLTPIPLILPADVDFQWIDVTGYSEAGDREILPSAPQSVIRLPAHLSAHRPPRDHYGTIRDPISWLLLLLAAIVIGSIIYGAAA